MTALGSGNLYSRVGGGRVRQEGRQTRNLYPLMNVGLKVRLGKVGGRGGGAELRKGGHGDADL